MPISVWKKILQIREAEQTRGCRVRGGGQKKGKGVDLDIGDRSKQICYLGRTDKVKRERGRGRGAVSEKWHQYTQDTAKQPKIISWGKHRLRASNEEKLQGGLKVLFVGDHFTVRRQAMYVLITGY